ncbi:MAG: hypothetical protein R3C32_04190 [Chloroflexota bacterium]
MTRPWDDPQLTGVGRVRMHSVPHEDRLVLDGAWRFQLLGSPETPLGDEWRDIAVPGVWTMQDTTDRPHYTNVQMPFRELPPSVPAANPTGVYRRTFRVPRGWLDKRVVLHVARRRACSSSSATGSASASARTPTSRRSSCSRHRSARATTS